MWFLIQNTGEAIFKILIFFGNNKFKERAFKSTKCTPSMCEELGPLLFFEVCPMLEY